MPCTSLMRVKETAFVGRPSLHSAHAFAVYRAAVSLPIGPEVSFFQWTNSKCPNLVHQEANDISNEKLQVGEIGEQTLSYSIKSARLMVLNSSRAKVLSRRSHSRIPRFRDWYVSRARRVSSFSSSLGNGVGGGVSEEVVVAFICSGVWGRGHGSAKRRRVDDIRRRCVDGCRL